MLYFDPIMSLLCKRVLDVREIDPKNFNPMCHHLLDPAGFLQIKIDSIGGPAWINVRREHLISEGELNDRRRRAI